MAVDKKSDHYTSATHYKDLDGNMKAFTFVDHDIKPGGATHSITDEEISEAKKQLKEFRKTSIERILVIPASLCPQWFTDFTVRGDVGEVKWNEEMLRDEGLPLDRIRDLKIMLENRLELSNITL
jgi:hypothetical protein